MFICCPLRSDLLSRGCGDGSMVRGLVIVNPIGQAFTWRRGGELSKPANSRFHASLLVLVISLRVHLYPLLPTLFLLSCYSWTVMLRPYTHTSRTSWTMTCDCVCVCRRRAARSFVLPVVSGLVLWALCDRYGCYLWPMWSIVLELYCVILNVVWSVCEGSSGEGGQPVPTSSY